MHESTQPPAQTVERLTPQELLHLQTTLDALYERADPEFTIGRTASTNWLYQRKIDDITVTAEEDFAHNTQNGKTMFTPVITISKAGASGEPHQLSFQFGLEEVHGPPHCIISGNNHDDENRTVPIDISLRAPLVELLQLLPNAEADDAILSSVLTRIFDHAKETAESADAIPAIAIDHPFLMFKTSTELDRRYVTTQAWRDLLHAISSTSALQVVFNDETVLAKAMTEAYAPAVEDEQCVNEIYFIEKSEPEAEPVETNLYIYSNGSVRTAAGEHPTRSAIDRLINVSQLAYAQLLFDQ